MSGKLRLTGSSSGYIELQAEAAANNATLTIPNGGFGGGKFLQALSATKTNSFDTSSQSWTDVTGLSIAITPSATSSKILVIYTINMSANDNVYSGGCKLVRGSTDIYRNDQFYGSTENRSSNWFSTPQDVYSHRTQWPLSGNFLDSPSSTSALTYKLQVKSGYSGNSVYVNKAYGGQNTSWSGGGASTITVMEIGA